MPRPLQPEQAEQERRRHRIDNGYENIFGIWDYIGDGYEGIVHFEVGWSFRFYFIAYYDWSFGFYFIAYYDCTLYVGRWLRTSSCRRRPATSVFSRSSS